MITGDIELERKRIRAARLIAEALKAGDAAAKGADFYSYGVVEVRDVVIVPAELWREMRQTWIALGLEIGP